MTQDWRDQVQTWMQEKQLEKAQKRLLQLVKDHPDDPEVLIHTAWVHDSMGLEREAVPYYVKALEFGLSGDDLCGALLGLGSTYRCLGEYEAAVETLKKGVAMFPDHRGMKVFLSMALYNTGQHRDAMELLLQQLLETSDDPTIETYHRALSFYAERLDETWA
ncbi:tetratricopeptide repeat protein [Desmospora activa]|uniref:Tetratricopeptide repeat protein n=1 Tax=Desmospora activa DSM 45169 TaxID=1121389 RepID=A0A2T4Z3N7_9BACL|nr:tetratricopeptide repeat protein [Desmospora activa]PTM56500.1 tetratricopeptide repeat protein [Desmospora activa DSM 45169]